MGVSEKVRAKQVAKANEVLANSQLPPVTTVVMASKKFSLTPVAILFVFVGVFVVGFLFALFKVMIVGGAVLGGFVGGFLQLTKPGRIIGANQQGYVLFARSGFSGKANKVLGSSFEAPTLQQNGAAFCGETLKISGPEVRHLQQFQSQAVM